MVDDSKVLIFAYGSNMCSQRLRARVSTAIPVTIGYVQQCRFVLHKRSDDGSAKADAAFSASSDDCVWGIVYQLQRYQKPILDKCEFLGFGYDEEAVDVVYADGAVCAWMYVARHKAIDATLLPYSWYLNLVIAGACEHRLPDPYIDHLRSFDSIVDPDTARHKENQRLIGA
jgi:gamma-glutamylcyclotransferase (GGCT)/AIG2-like uncharacterized protein YtfP